jgi:hypothetical protein
MRTLLLIFSLLALIAPSEVSAATNDHRTKASGEWSSPSIWERYNGTTWIDAENPPTTSDATVTILTGHSVSVQFDATIDQLVINEGGTVTVESGVIFTIADGTGDDLYVTGMLDVVGTLQFNGGGGGFKVFGTVRNSGTINGAAWYYASGRYQHNYTSTVGYIPAAAWYGSSTCEVIGYTTATGNMSVGAQTFLNITWNCPGQTGAINVPSQFDNLTGTFTVTSTGSGSLVFNNTTGSKSWSMNGGFMQSGGTIDLASSSAATNLNIQGAVSLLGGTLTETGSASSSYIRFTGSTSQNFGVNSGHTTANDVDYYVWPGSIVTLTQSSDIDVATMYVEGGSTFTCGQYVLSGAAFSTFPSAILATGNDNGIAAAPAASGSIQTTTRVYSTEAYYVYNHPSSMSYSGDGIPSTVSGLTSANTGGSLQMQKDVTVNGALVLTSPVQVGTSGGNTLTLGLGASLSGSSYVALDGSGKFVRYFTGAGTVALPVGTPGAYSPVSVTVSASAFTAPHLDVTMSDAKHASNTSASNYLTRVWTLSGGGITSPTYGLTFTYTSADVVGVESGIVCAQYTGSGWVAGNAVDPATNIMSISGLTSLGDFTGGEADALPIQLAAFTASLIDEGIALSWRTTSEINNYGFYIQRRPAGSGTFTDIPGAFVQGNGTSLEEHTYAYREPSPGDGEWDYRLRQVDLNGAEWFSEAVTTGTVTDVTAGTPPSDYVLEQNFPNPFNPTTTLRFAMPVRSHVRIVLYDLLGRAVAVLTDDTRDAGQHSISIDGRMLSSGIYVCRMQAEGFQKMVRMTLVK